jgi:hypothetical protein
VRKLNGPIYGGDSATGSGGSRAGNSGCAESCAPNGKWITSLAAIVAPQTCTLVRGALVLLAPARPAIQSLCFFRFFRLPLPR